MAPKFSLSAVRIIGTCSKSPPSSASSTSGRDSDFYIDTTNNVLYGPKAAGVWPVPGVAIGGAQGAASAYNNKSASCRSSSSVAASEPSSSDSARGGHANRPFECFHQVQLLWG